VRAPYSDVDKRGLSSHDSLAFLVRICYQGTDTAEFTFSKIADLVYDHTGKLWTWKYFHSLHHGSAIFRDRVSAAIVHTYNIINNVKKEPTDTRPGAIRIDFEEGIDKHEARALILANLTPKERGNLLLREAKELENG